MNRKSAHWKRSVEKWVCNTQMYNLPLSRWKACSITHLKFTHSSQYFESYRTKLDTHFNETIVTEMDLTLQIWYFCSTISGSNEGLFRFFFLLFQCIVMLKIFLYFKNLYFYFIFFLTVWSLEYVFSSYC